MIFHPKAIKKLDLLLDLLHVANVFDFDDIVIRGKSEMALEVYIVRVRKVLV